MIQHNLRHFLLVEFRVAHPVRDFRQFLFVRVRREGAELVAHEPIIIWNRWFPGITAWKIRFSQDQVRH